MSLIGKKVVFTLPKFSEKGVMSQTEVETVIGTILDKVFTSYPNPHDPNLPPLQYDMFLVMKESGDVLPLNPTYITQLSE